MHRWLATGLLIALLAPASLHAQEAAPSVSDMEQARVHYERGQYIEAFEPPAETEMRLRAQIEAGPIDSPFRPVSPGPGAE